MNLINTSSKIRKVLEEYNYKVQESLTWGFAFCFAVLFITAVIAIGEFSLLYLSYIQDKSVDFNGRTKIKFMLQFLFEDFLISTIKFFLFNNEVAIQLKSTEQTNITVTIIVTLLQFILVKCQLKEDLFDSNDCKFFCTGLLAVASIIIRGSMF